ncbi:MAG: CSLREA domain-containing protein [Pyrinomonadaceae bacterium]
MEKGGKKSLLSLINKMTAILFVCFVIVVAARAATFTVNSTGDGGDANTADNICETATIGECTLRAAIEEANFTMAADTIGFAIAPFNGSVKIIAPAAPLPDIIQPVIINGYTQTGASVNTAVTSDNC